jgi:hypothetical protein
VTRFSTLIALGVGLGGVPAAKADACDAIRLPAEIRAHLDHEFSNWRVVTSNLLGADDRQIWIENFNAECPGLAVGRFRGKKLDFAVNLIRRSGSSLEQQIVLFETTAKGFRTVILAPPSRVDIVSVIRKFAPGRYTSPDSEESVDVRCCDTIGVSEIEANTVVYYWNGKRFQQIVTSE